MFHGGLIVWAITSSWQIDRHQRLITIIRPQSPQFIELPPFGGTRRGIGPSGGLGLLVVVVLVLVLMNRI